MGSTEFATLQGWPRNGDPSCDRYRGPESEIFVVVETIRSDLSLFVWVPLSRIENQSCDNVDLADSTTPALAYCQWPLLVMCARRDNVRRCVSVRVHHDSARAVEDVMCNNVYARIVVQEF